NICTPPATLAFSIGEHGLVWEPQAVGNLDGDEVLSSADTQADRHSKAEAMEWLQATLSNGPREVEILRREAEKLGFSDATLRRAKVALAVKQKKVGFAGGWQWMLREAPEDAQADSVRAYLEKSTTYNGDPPRL